MAWRQTGQEDPAENRREQWQGKLGPKDSSYFCALCGKGAADGTLYSCKLEGEPTGKPGEQENRFYKQLKILRI